MIFWVLLTVVTVFILFVRLIISYATRITEKMMKEKFEDIETIINLGSVPEKWIKQVERRGQFLRLLKIKSTNGKEKEKKQIINRLEKLIKYFEKCPFFEDRESRDTTLDSLEKKVTEWKEKARKELI